MDVLIKDDDDIAKAHNEYRHFTEDDELRELYEARMKWQLDFNSAVESARVQGIEKGFEKGKITNKQEVLINQMSKKYSVTIEDKEFINSISDTEKLDLALDKILFSKNKDEVLDVLK